LLSATTTWENINIFQTISPTKWSVTTYIVLDTDLYLFARTGFTNSLGCVQDTEDNGDDISKGLELDISTRRKEQPEQPELAWQGKTKVEDMTLLKNSDLLRLIAVTSCMLNNPGISDISELCYRYLKSREAWKKTPSTKIDIPWMGFHVWSVWNKEQLKDCHRNKTQ